MHMIPQETLPPSRKNGAMNIRGALVVRSLARSMALSATAKPSNTPSSYALSLVPSGSNIAAREATVTGKHSFMYSTCNFVPATALSIGR